LIGNLEKKLGSLPIERGEQERALVAPRKRMVEMTVGGDEGGVIYPLRSQWLNKCGTAALIGWQCRPDQTAKN
jgi:hypothetical protein